MTDADITPEQHEGLTIARALVAAGVPVFSAYPCPDGCPTPGHGRTEYHLPLAWEQTSTVDSERHITRWRPGMALAAVGGHTADFLDEDRHREGATESVAQLQAAGHWPRVFGRQETPSGGRHHLISPLGESRDANVLPGLDYQGGRADGTGRAFVWIAPTVKRSKAPGGGGAVRAYRWIEAPNLEHLAEFAGTDHSGEGFVARLHAKRAREATPLPRASDDFRTSEIPAQPIGSPILKDIENPFMTASQLRSGAAGSVGPRLFTPEEAAAYVEPFRDRTRRAQNGTIEENANNLAVALAHFVGPFWTHEEAFAMILSDLGHTVYNPNGPSDWTADKFHSVLRMDGGRIRDPWRAEVKPVVYTQEVRTPPKNTGRLRAAMLSRSRLNELPDPVPLIEHVLYRESIMVISGKFGTYKSFLAVSLACSLATGREWFGHPVKERVPVIYAAAEGAYGIRKRVAAWERAHEAVPDSFYLIPISVRINRPDDMLELGELIAETGAGVVVFDTLHASTPGVDENDSGEMGQVIDTLRTLRDTYGVSTVLPHHTGHGGQRARGSSSIEDDADISFVIELEGEDRGPNGRRTLRHRKSKDDGLLEPVVLKLRLVEGTGSGYVTSSDAFEDAAENADRGPRDATAADVIAQPGEWTAKYAPGSLERQRLLQVVLDIGQEIGLTQSEARAAVAARWYEGKQSKSSRTPGASIEVIRKAWKHYQGAGTGPDGEPLLVPTTGEKLTLHAAVLAEVSGLQD